jgi:nucleotide-binding universal stress UspA family protein
MKSILLHTFDDAQMDARLSVALDACRAHSAHLTFVHVTPFLAYVGFDPMGMGGAFASSVAVDALREGENRLRTRLEGRMAKEDVQWDWQSFDGDPAQTLASASSLADLVVLSQSGPARGGGEAPLPIVDDVVVNAGCAVLVVPTGVDRYDPTAPVVAGWNGSEQAARALREARSALRLAGMIHLVSVEEDGDAFPQTDASAYLSRHGIASELHSFDEGSRAADAILTQMADDKDAGAILIGAYGHSRLRETVLGGVTRRILAQARKPVLLGR